MRATMLLTAACAGILVGTPAAAQPLVSVGDITVTTGDIDVFEDVLEHITILGTSSVTDTR
jgi:hypothetical protein